MDGGGGFEFLVFAGEVADDADGGVDGAHGPAGEAVETLPVGAEGALAELGEECGGEECGTLFVSLVDLVEEGVGEAGLGGELAHHLREQDGVGGHGCFRNDIGAMAAGNGEEAEQNQRGAKAHEPLDAESLRKRR